MVEEGRETRLDEIVVEVVVLVEHVEGEGKNTYMYLQAIILIPSRFLIGKIPDQFDGKYLSIRLE